MKNYSEERFCVYTHNDAEGNVKYVGSGVKARAYKIYAKSGRGSNYENYVIENGKLIVNIVKENLTKSEAIAFEIELYEKYKNENLLNIRKPIKIPELLSKAYLDKIFYYDESSQSGLRWKITKSTRVPKGSVAGSLDIKGYWIVTIDRKDYLVHRLIAIICGLALEKHSFIDHIDRNRSNNCIKNLRIATNAENSRNKSRHKNQDKFPVGVTFTECHNCFVAYVSDPSLQTKSGTNKLIQKRFYVRVHGYEKALELATKERAKMLSEIEQRLNIIYSDSHK